jgi:septal ring factor EnvC (AmiA/AmiB activator)
VKVFASAVRTVLRKERETRKQLQSEIADLRRELETLRTEFGTQRRLDEIQQRLVQLEASPRSGLRVA